MKEAVYKVAGSVAVSSVSVCHVVVVYSVWFKADVMWVDALRIVAQVSAVLVCV